MLHSYAKTNLQNLEEASDDLKRELYIDGQESLAKIIDEYNFMKYTRGADELWNSARAEG